MFRIISYSLPMMIVGLLFASLARADEDAEWIDLLQDKDLTQHWTTAGNWSMDDEGVVSLVPREGERGWSRFDAYLWLEGEYTDFEFEFQMALVNHKLAEDIVTVFLMPNEKYTYLNSTIVKEVARFSGDVSSFVSPEVQQLLKAKFGQK